MSLDDIRAQLEADQVWRREELVFFQNQTSLIGRAEKKDQYRRALVVMLYAHFEGFCKFALTLYVACVNRSGLVCRDVTPAIAASVLSDVFSGLRNPNKRCPEFRRDLPDDSKLHRFARDREFLERTDEISKREVVIPDGVVDTESNLTPSVLRKNLFRLGFPYDLFSELDPQIHRLLGYRNRIAHGETGCHVDLRTYEELRASVYEVMDEITVAVFRALKSSQFRRTA
jgi:hypothetical protein